MPLERGLLVHQLEQPAGHRVPRHRVRDAVQHGACEKPHRSRAHDQRGDGGCSARDLNGPLGFGTQLLDEVRRRVCDRRQRLLDDADRAAVHGEQRQASQESLRPTGRNGKARGGSGGARTKEAVPR